MDSLLLPPDASPSDPARDRTERQLRTLQALAEIGMDLARLLRDQAIEAPAGETSTVVDIALKFSRIARAVRQTVALEAKLEADRADRDHKAGARLTAETRARGASRKAEVRRAVERTIEADASEGDVEALLDDLDERLDDGRDDMRFADRPIGEIVARICRDLGVTPDWSVWEDEDWAIEEAAARAPGSPFATSGPADSPDGAPPPPWPAHHPPDKLS